MHAQSPILPNRAAATSIARAEKTPVRTFAHTR